MFREFHDYERRSRLFKKGDIKYVILDLIKNKPSHGYEIIHALEERFHGFYCPSAGSVYPTLQLLEELGYVSSSERDGKKVYTINDEGKRYLTEQGEVVDKIKCHMRDWGRESGREEFRDAFHELRDIVRLIRKKPHHMDKLKLIKIKEILTSAAHDIEHVIDEN
jgi:DNA-binding PadR family transcriptional regulator